MNRLILLIIVAFLGYVTAFITSEKPDKQLFPKDLLESLQSLDTEDTGNLDNSIADSLNNIGVEAYNNKNYQVALEYFKQAIAANTSSKGAAFNCGLCYSQLQFPDSAIISFSTAIAIDPEYETAYTQRAREYITLLNYDLAGQDLKIALEINPESVEALYYNGNVLELTGKKEQAIEAYGWYLNAAPKDHWAYAEVTLKLAMLQSN